MERPSEEQVAAWYPRLFRTALRMSGSQQDASDLTQEAFWKAFRNWHQFDGKSRPITWLYEILVNCVRDRVRKEWGRCVGELREWDLAAAGRTSEEVERGEQVRCLRKTILELDEKLRSPFVAAMIDGYTYDEIAELLSMPVGTVAHRVHQARRLVRQKMQRLFPDG